LGRDFDQGRRQALQDFCQIASIIHFLSRF
jgi:hypothetical protein